MSGYLPPPPPVSPFRTSFPFGGAASEENQENDPSLDNQQKGTSEIMPPTLASPVKGWEEHQIKEWLESIGCGSYARLFKENHICGNILLECDLAALKQLGIRKVGDRIRIHQSIRSLRAQANGERSRSLHCLRVSNANGPFSEATKRTLQELDLESVSPFVQTSRTNSPVDGYFAGTHSTATTGRPRAGSAWQVSKISQYSSSAPVTAVSTPLFQTVEANNSVSDRNVNGILSMDVVKQNTVKFIYTHGQSRTVNISDCLTSNEIKVKALMKNLHEDLSPDNWIVHVADNELGTTTRQLSDEELVKISQNANRLERKRLMLCPVNTMPTLKQLSKSQQILRDSLSSDPSVKDRDSVDSGSTLRPTAKEDEEEDEDETGTVFPDRLKMRKLGRLSGQRPPSELISSNLAHYFPTAESGVLAETVRNSIRFSRRVSRISRASQRMSSSSSVWGIPEDEEEIPPVPPVPSFDGITENDGTVLSAESQGLSSTDVGEHPAENEEPSGKDESQQAHISSEEKVDKPVRTTSSNHTSLRKYVIQKQRKSIVHEADVITKMANRLSSVSVAHSNNVDTTEEEEKEIAEEEDFEDSEFWRALKEEESCPTRWIKGRLIGSGSYATVSLGMNAFTGELMAVKQVELTADYKSNDRKKRVVDAWLQEMVLLRELHHENIVQYLGAKSEGDLLNIFLEYVPGGSVAMLLANYGVFEESLIRNFVRQILSGLKYLHDKNIVHRDIKGANVLVDNKGCIRITDFGISKKIEAELLTTKRESLKGSVYWMAPEVVKHSLYTFKGDIWSVGCLIIEMFSGVHPFPEFTQMQAVFRIGNSGTPTIPDDCSEEAKDLLKKTFSLDHKERPSASDLLEHAFLKPTI